MKAIVKPSIIPAEDQFSCFEDALRDYFLENELGDIYDRLSLDLVQPNMSFDSIRKFEKSNEGKIQIHILTAVLRESEDDNDVDSLDHFAVSYKSKNSYTEDVLQISLYLHKDHYYCIKKLGLFLHQSHRNYLFCFNCMSSFNRPSRLKQHEISCDSKHTIVPSFPKQRLEFTNYSTLQQPVYLVYFDLEATHSDVLNHESEVGTSIELINELRPIKIGYKIVFSETGIFDIHPQLRDLQSVRIFTGKDCITQFFRELKKVNYKIQECVRKIEPIRMTTNDVKAFRDATHCCICQQSYNRDINLQDGSLKDFNLRRVRHHSHLSGRLLRGHGNNDANIAK